MRELIDIFGNTPRVRGIDFLLNTNGKAFKKSEFSRTINVYMTNRLDLLLEDFIAIGLLKKYMFNKKLFYKIDINSELLRKLMVFRNELIVLGSLS